jgi:MtN3 and saliva related transmembrane protein
MFGAAVSTACWLPQALKIVRERQARGISLMSTIALVVGGALWLVYGIARNDWPLICSSSASLTLLLTILRLKLRYG